MKFNDSIVIESASIILKVVFQNACIERIDGGVLCLTPESLDLEITLNKKVVCQATFQAIGSFAPKEWIARHDLWAGRALSRPTREESLLLQSELCSALAVPDGYVKGLNQRGQNWLLNMASRHSDVFAEELGAIIEKHTPETIELESIIESLQFTRRCGEICWYAGSLPVESEEFWLHGNDEPIESCFEFTFDYDNTIELTATTRQPVGRVPLNNCFEVSITKASACLKTEDYGRLVRKLEALIVYEHIKPEVFPKERRTDDNFYLEAGGDPGEFQNRNTLEQRLQLLVDQEQERAEVENWEPLDSMVVSETAPMFQFAYGALEHLWTQPCLLSVRGLFQEFSGLIKIRKLIFAKFESTLKQANTANGFYTALLLAFEKDDGNIFFVAANCKRGDYFTHWESSDTVMDLQSSPVISQGISDEMFHALKEALARI